MKAFGYDKFGGPNVFQEYDLPNLEITKDNQVIVKTLAVGMNNFDRMQRKGVFGAKHFPVIPGHDVVGKVMAVGPAVSGVKIGDIVIGSAFKTYAEQVRMLDTKLIKKPANISNEDAVTIVTPGITAYNATHVFTNIKRSDKVLINGATGGVGSIAAQLAKKMGAYVIGVGSSRNAEYLKSLNLDEDAFYDKENINEKYANQIDVVINAAMNGANDTLIPDVVKAGGQAATVGQGDNPEGKNIKLQHIEPLDAQHLKIALQSLAEMLSDGSLKVRIFKTLPLTLQGVIAGQELLDNSHEPGRIVLVTE